LLTLGHIRADARTKVAFTTPEINNTHTNTHTKDYTHKKFGVTTLGKSS